MKVVFPRSGSLVLLKQDLETLKAFYNTTLLTSKMADMYKTSTTMIQIKNFNYIPKSDSLVLDNAHVLTINEMREILGIFNSQESTKTNNNEQSIESEEEGPNYIADDDILSNPFFTTLAPID